jgi:hypothetical protein
LTSLRNASRALVVPGTVQGHQIEIANDRGRRLVGIGESSAGRSGPTKECRRVTDERRSEIAPPAGVTADDDPVEETGRASAMNDLVGVGSGDENVAKIQLATRWSEQYAPQNGDSLDEALRRFKRVYIYVDSVTKLVEPDES